MSKGPKEGAEGWCPSIVFKLKKGFYSIDSGNVASIMQFPEYEAVPDAPVFVTGIFQFRGNTIPLLDLRVILGYLRLDDEYQSFLDMIEARKQDHLYWAEELRRCIEEGAPFTLATDPHKCAFGKWYDTYSTDNNAVAFHLNKIEDPHHKLHDAAREALECRNECDICSRQECLKNVLMRVEQEYVPTIVSLLDETKTVIKDTFREMVLVLDDGKTQAGIVVDDVLSVEALHSMCGMEEMDPAFRSEYVLGIAKSDKRSDLILEINSQKLFGLLEDVALS